MDGTLRKRASTVLLVLAVLCAYTWWIRLRGAEPSAAPDLGSIPSSVAGFESRTGRLPPESLRMLGADATLARTYTSPSGARIDLFIGWFAEQQENSQIHSPKHCYPGSGWDIIDESSSVLRISGERARVRRLLISDGEETRLVIYWFSMHGKVIPGEFSLKWNQMTSSLLSRPQSASFIRFSTIIPQGRLDPAGDDLVRFVEELAPDVMKALSGAPGGPERGTG